VIHLSHAADARDGGIAAAVAGLREAQQAAGLEAGWLTADRYPPLHRDRRLLAELLAAAPPLLHLHGLWRSPTRIASRLAAARIPLVIAPHGMLDPGALAISPRRKQLVWRLWEGRALGAARCLQALCPAEAAAIRTLLPQAPIAVIPNGVALPSPPAPERPLPPPAWSGAIPAGEPVLLFLARFHPKKGLDPLLAAWQAVVADARRAGWWLALVGYGDQGALARRVALAQARGELERLLVLGPAFAADKLALLESASAFVLPSFSEGLPMAALEAMAHRLPCLLSTACNLPEAFPAGAALAAEPDPAALSAALRQLFALSPAERGAMGAAGQALVQHRYSWPQVAEQTRQLYGWILGGGEPPPCLIRI
jgi:poly(glycerol-phosphate) alpha-glucosyltransferase